MKKLVLFSFLLILGLICSQLIAFVGIENRKWIEISVDNLVLIFLAFIMIHVGLECSIDRSHLKQYGWDHSVAFTAATLPWIFCTFYFVCFFQHKPTISQFNLWTDALFLARFAAPTSAGVLSVMMVASGLEETWVFKKARILAVFDDLDTIILLIPIKMLLVGFKWEALGLLAVIAILLCCAWKKTHSLRWPIRWYWVLIYSIVVVAICEGIYLTTVYLKDVSPTRLQILLPAFVLGCLLASPNKKKSLHACLETPSEKAVLALIGALFMFLVGLSIPVIAMTHEMVSVGGQEAKLYLWGYKTGTLSIGAILWHVLMITLLSNLGKMFLLFCYRKEARWKERFALSLGMCLRGEVGAQIIILAFGLITHIDQSLIVIAMLSLVLNLILTGPLMMMVKKLIS